MLLFKNYIFEKYENSTDRKKIFSINDLWKKPQEFINEYPIILSTTHSVFGCLGNDFRYDYIIVDEASQVDIVTGSLALYCADNIVIVGDLKQLPNVVSSDVAELTRQIFNEFDLENELNYADNSLLSSAIKRIENIPRTLLKEHYRCHPKIIGYCNHKFYNDELIIMTSDLGERDTLFVYKTVKGNHERNHYNQRQIDVIKNEVIPNLNVRLEDIGIISPYKAQKEALKNDTQDIEIDTVHKFQGREKNNIILTTVDDEITEFTDNPNLINVAVSRAVKRLCVVVSNNDKNNNTNIGDLIKYIEYNNFEINDSKIQSVFDLLYKDYAKERFEYLKNKKKISEYDSENIMYNLIEEILKEEKFSKFNVIEHYFLKSLINNEFFDSCAVDEKSYMNNGAHIDFVIFNKMNKQPALAIEVDGYEFHKINSKQALKDEIKNRILTKAGIPIIRFKTNGSEEKQKLIQELSKFI